MSPSEKKTVVENWAATLKKRIPTAIEEYKGTEIIGFRPVLVFSYQFLKLKKLKNLKNQLLQNRKASLLLKRLKAEQEADKEDDYEIAEAKEQAKAKREQVLERQKMTMHLLEYQQLRQKDLVKLKTIKPKIF